MTGAKDDKELLRRLPVVGQLSDAEQEELRPLVRRRVLARGEALWERDQAGDQLHFVVRGQVRFVREGQDGRRVLLNAVQQGDMLCASAPCQLRAYCCDAEALEDETEVISLPTGNVLSELRRSTPVLHELLDELANGQRAACSRIEEMSSVSVMRRVARLLLRLGDQLGRPRSVGAQSSGDGIWVPVAFSRQDLAEMTGTTVETAIRVLSQLRKQQIAEPVARGFLIRDRAALAALAQPSRDEQPPDSDPYAR